MLPTLKQSYQVQPQPVDMDELHGLPHRTLRRSPMVQGAAVPSVDEFLQNHKNWLHGRVKGGGGLTKVGGKKVTTSGASNKGQGLKHRGAMPVLGNSPSGLHVQEVAIDEGQQARPGSSAQKYASILLSNMQRRGEGGACGGLLPPLLSKLPPMMANALLMASHAPPPAPPYASEGSQDHRSLGQYLGATTSHAHHTQRHSKEDELPTAHASSLCYTATTSDALSTTSGARRHLVGGIAEPSAYEDEEYEQLDINPRSLSADSGESRSPDDDQFHPPPPPQQQQQQQQIKHQKYNTNNSVERRRREELEDLLRVVAADEEDDRQLLFQQREATVVHLRKRLQFAWAAELEALVESEEQMRLAIHHQYSALNHKAARSLRAALLSSVTTAMTTTAAAMMTNTPQTTQRTASVSFLESSSSGVDFETTRTASIVCGEFVLLEVSEAIRRGMISQAEAQGRYTLRLVPLFLKDEGSETDDDEAPDQPTSSFASERHLVCAMDKERREIESAMEASSRLLTAAHAMLLGERGEWSLLDDDCATLDDGSIIHLNTSEEVRRGFMERDERQRYAILMKACRSTLKLARQGADHAPIGDGGDRPKVISPLLVRRPLVDQARDLSMAEQMRRCQLGEEEGLAASRLHFSKIADPVERSEVIQRLFVASAERRARWAIRHLSSLLGGDSDDDGAASVSETFDQLEHRQHVRRMWITSDERNARSTLHLAMFAVLGLDSDDDDALDATLATAANADNGVPGQSSLFVVEQQESVRRNWLQSRHQFEWRELAAEHEATR